MLRRIAPDKWKHFIVGIGMGIFLESLFLYVGFYIVSASLSSLLVAAAISYGFELFSLVTGKGHYDFMDAVASIVGSLVGIGVVYVFYWGSRIPDAKYRTTR